MNTKTRFLASAGVGAMLLAAASGAGAKEWPIGKPQTKEGYTVGANFMPAMEVAPKGYIEAPGRSQIHLEADIHAAKENRNGFEEGAYVPYLEVHYTLMKDGKLVTRGVERPMIAKDGPHYADNVKLNGPGTYWLTYEVAFRQKQFGRHVDADTGVDPFPHPMTFQWEFEYPTKD